MDPDFIKLINEALFDGQIDVEDVRLLALTEQVKRDDEQKGPIRTFPGNDSADT